MENNATTEKEKLTHDENAFKLEKFKIKVEVFKWFIGSVVLVSISMIIEKGFRERAAGIQEMNAYDKYVAVILEADNIEKRWKLTQYFSTVTPTERLRERWEIYRDSISKDYKEFIKLKLAKIPDTISKAEQQRQKNEVLMAQYETPLVSVSNSNSKSELASAWEEQGFFYLLKRDVKNAIYCFKQSEATYNQYHQVYEIAKYLDSQKELLYETNSPNWKIAFRKIATSYSWKMPKGVKDSLLASN